MAFAGMQITPEVFSDIQGFRRLIEMGIAPAVVARTDIGAALDRLAGSGELGFQVPPRPRHAGRQRIMTRTYQIMAAPIKTLMEMGKGARGAEVAVEQHREARAA